MTRKTGSNCGERYPQNVQTGQNRVENEVPTPSWTPRKCGC